MHHRALSDEQLCQLLRDDVPAGDLTTEGLGIEALAASVTFHARAAMTVCGSEEAARLFELVGATAEIRVASGVAVDAGALLLEAAGQAGALHRVWKVAQTLMEWSSGIASATAELVAAARPATVGATRKNIPGVKAMSVKAVMAGGAAMHRLGLSDTVLVFAEHRQFLAEEPARAVSRLRHAHPERKVMVEVADPDEMLLWARAGADALQLEKFAPQTVAQCRATLAAEGLTPILIATGGIRTDNAAAYAAAGADALATSAPFYAPPRDVQVRFALASGE